MEYIKHWHNQRKLQVRDNHGWYVYNEILLHQYNQFYVGIDKLLRREILLINHSASHISNLSNPCHFLSLELVLVYLKLAFAYFLLLVVYLKCLLVSSHILYRENCKCNKITEQNLLICKQNGIIIHKNKQITTTNIHILTNTSHITTINVYQYTLLTLSYIRRL